jgi:small subunit ribosomal protein S16
MGNSHRPFYRVVVAHSTRGRDGAFKELIGTYNPLTKPKLVSIDKGRALHWLLEGAQPTETVAYLLKKEGVLDEFFAKRPGAKGNFKFLDKTTGAMSKKSVVQEMPAAEAAPEPVAPAPEPVAEPVAEQAAEPVAEQAAEPAAEPAQE